MRKRKGPQYCSCTYYGCQDKLVSAEDWYLHNELSEAAQLKALESEVTWMVLSDPQPPNRRTPSTTAPVCDGNPSTASHSPRAQSSGTSRAEDVYRELYRLDIVLHDRLQQIQEALAEWSHSTRFTTSLRSPSRFLTRMEAQQFLAKEMSWLQEMIVQVQSMQLFSDHANKLLRAAMVEKAGEVLSNVSSVLGKWAGEEEDIKSSPDFFSTG